MRSCLFAVACFGVLFALSACSSPGTTNGQAAGAGIGALINNSVNQIQAPPTGSGAGNPSSDPGVGEDGLRYYGPL